MQWYSALQPAALTLNGTVVVELLESYTPAAGDSFTLWTALRSFKKGETATYQLPALPDGLYWDVSGLFAQTGVLKVTDDATSVGHLSLTSEVTCQLFTMGGSLVATFTAQRAQAKNQARCLGVAAGTYVLKMQGREASEVEKVIIR